MTPNEIHEAAERVTKLIELVERNLVKWRLWYPNEESEVDVPRADLLALITLANAYLSAHPADDAEPVTEEWYKSLGLTEKQNPFYARRNNSNGVELYLSLCGTPYTFTTRGQVRQLLAALNLTK